MGLFFLLQPILYSASEVIDRIAAVVAGEVITMSDVSINRAFCVHDTQDVSDAEKDLFILNKLIEQKLLIQMIESDIVIPDKDLDIEVRSVTERMGPAQTQSLFIHYGVGWDEIKDCFREKLLYRGIIFKKFNRSAFVSLKEIESYYNQTYVPSQKAAGSMPKSMLEVVGEIEAEIKQDKIQRQVKEWIKKLKQETDIQILI